MKTSALVRVSAIGLLCVMAACEDGNSPGNEDQAAGIETRSSAATIQTSYVALQSDWLYWHQGENFGTAWREHAWAPPGGQSSGRGPLGYGENYVTTIPYGSDPSQKPITVYFRKAFFVENPANVVSLRLDVMYDDGFVFYVNGQEGGRGNMPGGAVTHTTFAASSHEANAVYGSFDASAVRGALNAGWNTLAVEVHQHSPSSSDLVFDAALVAQVGSPPPPPAEGGIARRSAWSYWDRGGDLGTPWRGGSYDSSSWANGPGPLGYGESYLATGVSFGPNASNRHITTYFRKTFTVSDPAAVVGVRGEIMYDDGVVVYVNGQEIGRDSMPAGTTTAATFAFDGEANNAYRAYDWTSRKSVLVAGANTIAVEVHQKNVTSSDLVFDLALSLQLAPPGADAGTPPPPPPPPPSGGVEVCATGATFTTIGAAIAAAPAGATIQVCPGTYFERITINAKPLRLVGSGGAGRTIVDGSAAGKVLDIQGTGGTGVSLEGLTFRNGSTGSNGGGISCTNSTLRMADSVVSANVAQNGGGLSAAGCALDISRTRFEQNRSRDQGGGALLDDSSGRLGDSELLSNQSVLGAGLAVREGTLVIQSNQLRSNIASLRGGGLYHDSSSLVVGNSFIDNEAGWTGGGIHTVGHTATFRDNTVSGNRSVNDGGGIYAHQGQPTIIANRFQSNHAGDDGGGIRMFESNCRLEANVVEQNIADDTGGGIRVSHLPCQIIENIVRNNTATNTGGGMDLDNDASFVRGGEVTGNKASKGAGIFMWRAPWNGATIADVLIANNQAWRGGGIHLDDNFQHVTLGGLTLANNTADEGGGLYVRATNFTLVRSVFKDNRAGHRGGGLYTGAPGRWHEACPCPPTNPHATIDFITVHGNSAPAGAGLWTSFGDLSVASSILFSNSGGPSVTAGGAPATPSVPVPPRYHFNDTWPATFSGMADPTGSIGNIAADPLFVNAAGGDFHLGSGSTCVNAGDPAAFDPDGSRADMGRHGGP